MTRLFFLWLACLGASACGPKSIGSGGVASGSSLVPPMPPHVTTFQRWEHLCFGNFLSSDGASEGIAEAGSQGWEMVGIGESVICFKRPAPPPAGAVPGAQTPQPAPETPPAPAAPTTEAPPVLPGHHRLGDT